MSKKAIVFAGQGSQENLMGKDLAEKQAEIMDLWKKAEKYTQLDLRAIYWESNDPKLMADTASLQAAQFVTEIGYFLYALPKLPDTFGVAGHSLGEFMALAAAKVLELDEALQLVALRGKLMSEAKVDGAMCAIVKITLPEVEEILNPILKSEDYFLRLANFNCPEQNVISGELEAIRKATELLKIAGKGRAIPLAVSSAFHTEKMQEPAKEFAKALQKATWHSPKHEIYSNVTAEALRSDEDICQIMSRQMVSPVQWTKLIENMYTNGYNSYTEIGPKDVLTKLIAKILVNKEIQLLNLNNCQQIDNTDKI